MITCRTMLLGEFQNSMRASDFGCFTYPAIKDSLLISNTRHWHRNLKGCDLLCRPENSRRRWLRRRSTFRSWSIRRRRRCECRGTGRCFPANIFQSWAWKNKIVTSSIWWDWAAHVSWWTSKGSGFKSYKVPGCFLYHISSCRSRGGSVGKASWVKRSAKEVQLNWCEFDTRLWHRS